MRGLGSEGDGVDQLPATLETARRVTPGTQAPPHTLRGGAFVRHPEPMPAALKFTGADKDMTLDELAAFIDAARKAGVPGDNPIRAELSTSGKIKEVETALDEDDD